MGGFQSSIGVTLEEKVKNSLQLGSRISTRNIGIAMQSVRGVANQVFLFTDPKDRNAKFGGFSSSMYSPYVLNNLFENLGGYGVNIYGLRIVGDNCEASQVEVQNIHDDTQDIDITVTTAAASGIKQVDTITISGEIEVGDTFSLVLGGVTISYEAVLGDTPALVKTGLIAAINTYRANGANSSSAWVTTTEAPVSGSGGVFTIRGATANVSFALTGSTTNTAAPESIFYLIAAYQGLADVGTWGDDLSVKVYPIGHANGNPTKYLLNVYYKNSLVESFAQATWQSLQDEVNTVSDFVMMEEIDYGVELDGLPFEANLSGGVYNAPVQADYEPKYADITNEPSGLAIFDSYDVQLLVCPEIFTLDFHQKCDAFAKAVKKFYVWNMPFNATESQVTSFYNGMFSGSESFNGGYLQWAQVYDENGAKIWIPALGYILGAGYIRVAGLNNGNVWTPPAGTQSNSFGVIQFSHANMTDTTMSRYVKTWHINVIKFIKQTGWVIWSSRTMSNDDLHSSIHVRLEANWLGASLVDRGAKFIQKLISESFLKEVQIDYLAFMQNIYNKGGIENTIPFDTAVVITVTVNKEDRKATDLDVSYIPPECNEHMHITLSRNDGILSLV